MGIANPQIRVGDVLWQGWKAATVNYGAKQAVRAFAFTATDNKTSFADQWDFMPGTEVQVMESGELMAHGFIDKMAPSYDDKNHRVDISGRSKSGDTVDSSAEHDTGEFRNKNILQIAKALDKQNVGFHSSVSNLEPIDVFRINPFETVFEAVERLARKQQLLMIGQADGSIEIASGGMKHVNAPLIEGMNILGASACFDDSDRHSEYKVKGQRAFGSSSAQLQIKGKATDSGVKRHRPKHIAQETDVDNKAADKRSKYNRDRQKGESISASVKLRGWRDDNGALFVPNTLIYVYSPMLKLDMDLLIESIACSMDSGGSFTQLSLVQPEALGSTAKTGSGASSEWK